MFDVRPRGRQSKRRALQATLVVVALVVFLWGLGGTAEARYGFVFRPSAGAPHSVFTFAFTAPFNEDEGTVARIPGETTGRPAQLNERS